MPDSIITPTDTNPSKPVFEVRWVYGNDKKRQRIHTEVVRARNAMSAKNYVRKRLLPAGAQVIDVQRANNIKQVSGPEVANINPSRLIHMLQLETAATEQFGDLSPKEQMAYLKANPASKMQKFDTGLQEGARKRAEHHAIKSAEHHENYCKSRNQGQFADAELYKKCAEHHKIASQHYKDAQVHYRTGSNDHGHQYARKGAQAASKAYKYEEQNKL